MIWGSIIKGRKGPLVVLEYPSGKGGGMNSTQYQEQVLEAHLKAFYAQMAKERGSVKFQQDNAASHVSKTTHQWLENNKIKLFSHPASSPDLSAIEPLWHELKIYICKLPSPPTSLQQLKSAVFEAWEAIPVESIDKQVKRMPDRVEAVIKAKGGHTRF